MSHPLPTLAPSTSSKPESDKVMSEAQSLKDSKSNATNELAKVKDVKSFLDKGSESLIGFKKLFTEQKKKCNCKDRFYEPLSKEVLQTAQDLVNDIRDVLRKAEDLLKAEPKTSSDGGLNTESIKKIRMNCRDFLTKVKDHRAFIETSEVRSRRGQSASEVGALALQDAVPKAAQSSKAPNGLSASHWQEIITAMTTFVKTPLITSENEKESEAAFKFCQNRMEWARKLRDFLQDEAPQMSDSSLRPPDGVPADARAVIEVFLYRLFHAREAARLRTSNLKRKASAMEETDYNEWVKQLNMISPDYWHRRDSVFGVSNYEFADLVRRGSLRHQPAESS